MVQINGIVVNAMLDAGIEYKRIVDTLTGELIKKKGEIHLTYNDGTFIVGSAVDRRVLYSQSPVLITALCLAIASNGETMLLDR